MTKKAARVQETIPPSVDAGQGPGELQMNVLLQQGLEEETGPQLSRAVVSSP